MINTRTLVLMLCLTSLLALAGATLGGRVGMVLALLPAVLINFSLYWHSDRMLLSSYNLSPLKRDDMPWLFDDISDMANRAEIPMPKIFVLPEEQANAFATGRNPGNAAIVFTRGLLRRMDRTEVAGVAAHELAHIQNGDTLTMTIVRTMAGAVSTLANFGSSRSGPLGPFGSMLLILLAPFAATVIHAAISRSREFEADRNAATICGHPLWLASALRKLESDRNWISNHAVEKDPTAAHLYIVNPLSGGFIGTLFSTHPRTSDRIRALEILATTPGGFGSPT